MIAFTLGFRSVMRRGLGLLTLLLPAAVLFSMLTFVVASESSIRMLTKPGAVDRSLRLGTVSGYPSFGYSYTGADIRRLSAMPNIKVGPGNFFPCYVDSTSHNEFTCGYANRTFLEIHEYTMDTSKEDLDRWDSMKNGAIITRSVANKYHWKVGDQISLHVDGEADLALVVSSVQEKYLEETIYYHTEYEEQLRGGKENFWSVWLLADSAEQRDAIASQIDADLNAIHRPHTIWHGEDTVKLLLGTSKTLTQVFQVSGVISLFLVVALSVTLLIVSIERRTTEFAALLAIGYRRAVIARSILIEGTVLLFLGAFAGAFLTAVLFHDHPLAIDVVMSVKVPFSIAIITTLGGTLLGFLTAIVPAWRLYRLDTLAGLRS